MHILDVRYKGECVNLKIWEEGRKEGISCGARVSVRDHCWKHIKSLQSIGLNHFLVHNVQFEIFFLSLWFYFIVKERELNGNASTKDARKKKQRTAQ